MVSALYYVVKASFPRVLRAVLFGVALFLAGALVSYVPHDPSGNVATMFVAENKLGAPGAWWSDALFQLMGELAYTLPLFLTYSVFQTQRTVWGNLYTVGVYSGGFFLTSFGLTFISQALEYPSHSFMSWGGAVGFVLQHGALTYVKLPPLWHGCLSLIVGMLGVWLLWISLGGKWAWIEKARHRAAQGVILLNQFLRFCIAKGPKSAHDIRPLNSREPAFQSAQRSLDGESDEPVASPDQVRIPNIPEDGVALPARDALLKDYEQGAGKRAGLSFFKEQKTVQTRESSPLASSSILPPLDLLPHPKSREKAFVSKTALKEAIQELSTVLDDFGIRGDIVQANPGPVVTLYELEPAAGLKSSRVISLADDIARSMSALSARVAVVPGRNIIGVELPNQARETVFFQDLLATQTYQETAQHLPLVLGKNIGGTPVIADLTRMPHLLVAGTTGSGKSVGINAMILSLIFRLSPEQCKFIMIDPKMLELSVYDGIPHLLTPVVTDPKKAVVALKWVVREMENRYRSMAQLGVRNIENYNRRLKEARESDRTLDRKVQTGFDPETGEPLFETQAISTDHLPFIVVIVDEMADLMLVAGKEIEAAVQRLAQMARAAGIHLIMATQRPSVDVITGTIKANFPTRISFQVTSKIDSRTILGEQGAEQLLGQGDMLYMASGGRITRVHGPFVSDGDVEQVVQFLKRHQSPVYVEDITLDPEMDGSGEQSASGEGMDPLYGQAVSLVQRDKKASTSYIQRHFQIGYNRAARIMDQMEKAGVVSEPNHVGKREVLS